MSKRVYDDFNLALVFLELKQLQTNLVGQGRSVFVEWSGYGLRNPETNFFYFCVNKGFFDLICWLDVK